MTIIQLEIFYVQLVSSLGTMDPFHEHLSLSMMQHSQVIVGYCVCTDCFIRVFDGMLIAYTTCLRKLGLTVGHIHPFLALV